MKDRLIELIRGAKKNTKGANCDLEREHLFADYLIENGVIVLPCKVGDTLWVVWSYTKAQQKKVYPVKVYALRYDNKKNNMRVCVEGDFKIDYCNGYYTHRYQGTFSWENIGKTVFLTREEAEQKLGGADNGNL